ncbi:hypothetical protein AVDCRST_MAG94-2532 [uncultured Leptolyngbya sp.]|uniref:Uncharacterized protein n=1 Tax=uncultured Leptolyngbya sp. TaxID=332963 RepID=A0A6J4M4I9_9CYAN|nr:hypothetical protein AVDCRST_MAG94-2532 [uncultured Leptolyngbya sp.]
MSALLTEPLWMYHNDGCRASTNLGDRTFDRRHILCFRL